jgi:hypothetical protein
MSEGTLGETTPDSRHINNDDMSPSTTHSGDPMVPRSSHRSRLLFWLKKHEPARAVVLSPFDLKRDLDDELHTREGGDAFISTMGIDNCCFHPQIVFSSHFYRGNSRDIVLL